MKEFEILGDTFSIIGLLYGKMWLIISGTIGIFLFHAPARIIIVLLGIEFIVTIITIVLRIKSRAAKKQLPASTESSKQMMAITAYYTFLLTIIRALATIAMAGAFWYFKIDIINYLTHYLGVQVFAEQSISWIVVVLSILALLSILNRYITYVQYKRLQGVDLAGVAQAKIIADDNRVIFNAVIAIVFWAGLSWFLHLPFFFFLILASFSFVSIAMSNKQKKRNQSIILENPPENITTPIIDTPVMSDNGQILLALYGVLNCAPTYIGTLGAGMLSHPENTLLVTENGFLFIQVPVTGGANVVGNVPFGILGFYWNRGEIRQKGEELVKSEDMSKIQQHAKKYFAFSDIQSVTLKQSSSFESYFSLRIKTLEGAEHVYQCADSEYLEPLRHVLLQHLGDRLQM